MTNSNLKLQQKTISLLEVFINICKQNDLQYYFTGGALIGVLRHKGFIPWDDDIDLGMPRKDYERFLQIMKEKPIEGYGILNRYSDCNWHFAMSQFVDKKIVIEIDIAEKKRTAYVWLDIFPLDGLPSNIILRWFRIKHILGIRYLIQLAHIETQVDSHRQRPWYEKVILKVFKYIPAGKILNTNGLLNILEKTLKKTDFETANYAGNMLGRYREREVVLKKLFGSPKQGEFEGIMVNIPEYSHELLIALYGDYLKLPPEGERVAHNVKILKC